MFGKPHKQALVPGAAPNDVVILDNLSSHRGPRIRDRIRAASAELVFLPPYSSDYNPIDLTITSSKALLHKAVGFDPG